MVLSWGRQGTGRPALRERFGIAQVCIVADGGMISAATFAALEKAGLE